MDAQWHIMCAVNDSELFDAIKYSEKIDLCIEDNIDPTNKGYKAEDIIELAKNADANLVIMTVETFKRESDAAAFNAAEQAGEMNFIMLYDDEASAMISDTYRSMWGDAALPTSWSFEQIVQAIVDYCGDDEGEEYGAQAEEGAEEAAYQEQAEGESAYAYDSGNIADGADYPARDDEDDDEEGDEEADGILDRIIAPFTDEDGRINKTGVLALIALALLLVFALVVPKGNKKKEAAPEDQPAIADTSEQSGEDASTGAYEPAFIEDEPIAAPEPTPAFEPINMAQQGYDAIMAALGSVDLANLETVTYSNFNASVIGCAAGYDKNNNPVAVAAYKIENTGATPLYFMEDMYGHAQQNDQTLTVDTTYLQGEALNSANKSIDAGQTLIVYQAYRLNTSKDDVTACIESWNVDEPELAKTYRIAQ